MMKKLPNQKEIKLGDEKFFELFIGKRMLQSQLYKSIGTIPVYSGNVTVPFGYVEKSNIENFDHDHIIWGIDDANFDFGLITKGTKFDITDHCGAMKILDKHIVPEYVFHQLQLKKKSLRFDWLRRPNLGEMSKITVNIPLVEDGSCFDIDLQQSVARKFDIVRETQREFKQIQDSIKNVRFEVSEKDLGDHKLVNLGNKRFFTINNGERIRKEDIEKAKGDIPVYSTSKFEEDVLGHVSNNIKEIIPNAAFFEGTNLTVSADGSVGSVFVRQCKFCANDVCNVITVNDPHIDPFFVKYELRTQIYQMRLNWTNKLYKHKLRQINIRIPVDKNGKFDLTKQKSLINKYHFVENLKTDVQKGLGSLIKIQVRF